MKSVDVIKQLPYWQGTSARALEKFCTKAETVHIDKGSIITEQFKSATDFYLLCDGSVDHYQTLLSETQLPIPVGRLDSAWSAIGWSGFLEPHRYTTQTQSSCSSTLLRWDYDTLKNLADEDPQFYRGLLVLITESSKSLLDKTRSLLNPLSTPTIEYQQRATGQPPRLRLKLEPDACINHLSYSNLFQGLKFYDLKLLAENCWLERCNKGMEICSENATYTDVLLLVKGTVNLYYRNDAEGDVINSSKIFVRSLSQPGQVISWAAMTLSQQQDMSAYADENATICCIPAEAINRHCATRAGLAIKLRENLLQIIGSRLRSTRALLMGQYTGNEQATVSSLLHNIGPQLSINSPLHKVPYLLRSRNTQEDAFDYLDRTLQRGAAFEKNVAGLCSDILTETKKESEVYRRLKSIYHLVVNSNKNEPSQAIRNKSARQFAELFTRTRYQIKGENYLPKSGGHIFILNHLVSHPYHMLPNGFEFSLDTHFISSMILYPKYGDSGLRVVRKNRHEEYGHESYYQRLGHIYVNTSESQHLAEKKDSPNLNEKFFETASDLLKQGHNIIICPEGTSHWSKDSPGAFRSGAFRLAAMQDTETLIVPVAVAGFDKPLTDTVFTAVIKPPFRIHNVVNQGDPDAMKMFLTSIHAEYKTYVKEAQQLGIANRTHEAEPKLNTI